MEIASYMLVGQLLCPQKDCRFQMLSRRRKFVLLFLVPVAILVQRFVGFVAFVGTVNQLLREE
jgi:hypothetical protein